MRRLRALLVLQYAVLALAQHTGLATAADASRDKRVQPAATTGERSATAWQGFTSRHRIAHGNGRHGAGEEEHKRKWYEPAYAEYRMADNTVFQYVLTLIVFATPALALFLCARKTSRDSWLGQACLISEADESPKARQPKVQLV